MSYFVTGATGFIGRNLVEQLLERDGTIYVLVREGSRGRLEELRSRWGAEEGRIIPVTGDLSQENLGCGDQIDELRGQIELPPEIHGATSKNGFGPALTTAELGNAVE